RTGQAQCIGSPSLRTEAVLLQSNAPPHPVGAPAPGANGAGSVFWFDFASHRGGASTIERVPPPVGAPAPGANKRSPGPHQGRRSGKPNCPKPAAPPVNARSAAVE